MPDRQTDTWTGPGGQAAGCSLLSSRTEPQSLPELRTCEPTRKGRCLAWASVQLSGWVKGPARCARRDSEQLK